MKIRSLGKISSVGGRKSIVKAKSMSDDEHFKSLFGVSRQEYEKEKALDEKFQKSQIADKDGWFVNEFIAENSGDWSVGIPSSESEIIVKTKVPLTLDDKKMIEDTLRSLEDLPYEKNDLFNPDFVGLKKDLIARDDARDKGMYEASLEASDRGWKKVKNTRTFKSWKNGRGDYVNLYLEGNSWRFQTNKRGDFVAGSTSLNENLKEAKKLREELSL